MAQIRLASLVKRYDNGAQAVSGINLEIADGEFLVLVGPSGCGKSTTLRMIAGLEEVTSGEIFLGDTRVNDLQPSDRDVAMVFQNYALYPHMTVRQNMSFGLRMRKTATGEIGRRVSEAAKVLSLEALLDLHPKQLSGGQRQRVAVGRAIVRQPQAFLFDEPLSNLDAKLRVQMRIELARLRSRKKTTTVYVTHDQIEAMTLGDRIAVMKDGVLQQVGSPLEVYRRPANLFVAEFIGSPGMNFIDGRISNGQFVFDGGQYQLHRKSKAAAVTHAAGSNVTLGFRPESITVDHQHPKLADVQLDVVERVGHETLVYFELAGKLLAARLDGRAVAQSGDTLGLHLRQDDWHLFAAEENESGDRRRLV